MSKKQKSAIQFEVLTVIDRNEPKGRLRYARIGVLGCKTQVHMFADGSYGCYRDGRLVDEFGARGDGGRAVRATEAMGEQIVKLLTDHRPTDQDWVKVFHATALAIASF